MSPALTVKEGVSVGGGGGGGAARGVTGVPVVADAELKAQQLGRRCQHGGRVKHPAQPEAAAPGQEALGIEKPKCLR